jgi:DNA-binding response OmpR family regulator
MIILIVEDEGLVSLAMEWALRIAGHDVLGPAGTVEEAIALTGATEPDLALVDLNLRDGGDGSIVARHLHERYHTPILFLTAQVAHARANEDAAWGLIRKPYDTNSLPRIAGFIDDLTRGRTPAGIPPELELFRPVEH